MASGTDVRREAGAGQLEDEKRMKLSRLLKDARRRKGWQTERLAEEATRWLAALAASQELSAEEREAAANLLAGSGVTTHHVARLENFPAYPMSTPERRVRLLAVVLALGLDRAQVNRLAGGL